MIIRNATIDDIDIVYDIHTKCIEELKESVSVGSETYLDFRSKKEVEEILKEKKSLIVEIDKEVVAYFLFVFVNGSSLISKGIVVTDKGKGLGLQRLVHKLLSREYKVSYVVSKYNHSSLKNILSLGLKPKYSINSVDIYYE